MSKWQLSLLVAGMTATGGLWAQTQTAPDSATESAASQASEEASKEESRVTPGSTYPAPSTRQTEGTAADSTPPGATATRPADPGTANPMPATSRAEGTAADRTPPGETPVRGTAAGQAPEQVTSRMAMAGNEMSAQQRGSKLIGMEVQGTQGQRIGTVQDLVFDSRGQITHAVVAHGQEGGSQQMAAIPWGEMQQMVRGGKVIVDESRLTAAPSFSRGQWPDLTSGQWSADADRFWRNPGGSSPRSAQPE
jgi:sporulation protein YlmC with PRC-barrel domain